MYKVALRNYEKSKGKILYSCYNIECLRNFVYHNLLEKLENIVDDELQFRNEQDFIDIEKNNKIIVTLYDGLDSCEIDRALWYIDKEIDKELMKKYKNV